MHLSKMALSLGQSATLRLNELANTLKAEGKPVIHLGGGEPEEKIPDGAYSASLKKLESRYIRYTATSGVPDLKAGIAAYTEKFYGVKPAAGNIVVSSGAKQAIYNFLLSVVNPDDEVVFPAPYWVSYPEMVRMAGGEPVVVRPEAGSVVPTLAQFEAAFTPQTKAVMLNSPNNPSGAVFGPDVIKGLVELCERRGVWLMMDDIYNRLVFDGQKAPSAFDFSKKPLDESIIVSINGVSKTFSMTGFRIGWSVAQAPLTRAMVKVQAQITSCPSALSQAAAAGALAAGGDFVESLRKGLEKKRDVMVAELAKLKKAKLHKPQGTFYSFPDLSAYDKDSTRLSNMLLEKAMVVTVPGVEFGLEGHLRLSYCGAEKDIIEGVSRIRKVLD
ncbi:MAG: aminotransferase class I/II-fold pyridoxal phosphate-dependent enzyme [Elusimicrobiales bacterium]|jgi:aspartate aminotransferase|nr:aminotransferase class I/II-fold pyridoxal phosphate-dependent enzyme [Elusimicrobiales bacterium]